MASNSSFRSGDHGRRAVLCVYEVKNAQTGLDLQKYSIFRIGKRGIDSSIHRPSNKTNRRCEHGYIWRKLSYKTNPTRGMLL